MSGMTVSVVGWSAMDARAYVDGVHVRIQRTVEVDRWICAWHGERTDLGHCAHTAALAETPADPQKCSRKTNPRRTA